MTKKLLAALLAAALLLMGVSFAAAQKAGDSDSTPKELQVIFMLGQSEMVGNGDVASTGYMLQKPWLPPRDITLDAHKAMEHQINGAYLYWRAMESYDGPAEKKKELERLLQERTEFKASFKQKVIDELEKNDGMFRGKKYSKRRGAYRGFWLFNMCDDECEKVGLTPKIREILDAPDNRFSVASAYEQLVADSRKRYQRQQELKKLYLNGATPESLTAYTEAVKAFQAASSAAAAAEKRAAIAALAETHLSMPLAMRTYITGLGTIAGASAGDSGNIAGGKLSVGYGANERSIGLEYSAGMALEEALDAPILIVKCAWDSRRSIADFWRMPDETVEQPGLAWTHTSAHIRKVLKDPGKYHPGYDAKAGFEAAGVIWSQGGSDKNNPEYAAQLASLLSDIRKVVDEPELPVVCATVGGMYFQAESDVHAANAGMKAVAAMDGFKGTVSVLDTYLWSASELGLLRGMIHKRKIKPDADLQARLKSAGSAPFYLLAGHEAGKMLAQMIDSDR